MRKMITVFTAAALFSCGFAAAGEESNAAAAKTAVQKRQEARLEIKAKKNELSAKQHDKLLADLKAKTPKGFEATEYPYLFPKVRKSLGLPSVRVKYVQSE